MVAGYRGGSQSMRSRTLAPDFCQACSKDLKGHDFIQLTHACLQLGYMAPEKYISAADVKRFFNNQTLSNLVTADKLCAKVRDLAGKANIKDVELINKFHRGCVSLIGVIGGLFISWFL